MRVTQVLGQTSPVAPTNLPLALICEDLPRNSFGYFLVSRQVGSPISPAGSAGNLCLSGAIGRYAGNVLNSGPDGVVSMPTSGGMLPQPTGTVAISAGEWWYFQYWTRDSSGGAPTSNFSNATRVWFD